MRSSALTVTLNPAIDVSMTVDRVEPTHKLRARDVRREPGGGGVNVARVLVRLGESARALVAVGGATGAEVLAGLAVEAVPTVAVDLDQPTREVVMVSDATTGEQYRFVTPGAALSDSSGLVDRVVAQADGESVVVLSGSLPEGTPPDLYRRICDRLDAPLTLVDCSGPALEATLQSRADVVKPSLSELCSLVGSALETDAEIAAAAHELLGGAAVGALAVSLGARGALLARRDRVDCWFVPPEVTPVSAVGAGDSMVAGIAAGLVRTGDLDAAVRMGVAAGTAAVLSPGTELCDPADVARYEAEVAVRS